MSANLFLEIGMGNSEIGIEYRTGNDHKLVWQIETWVIDKTMAISNILHFPQNRKSAREELRASFWTKVLRIREGRGSKRILGEMRFNWCEVRLKIGENWFWKSSKFSDISFNHLTLVKFHLAWVFLSLIWLKWNSSLVDILGPCSLQIELNMIFNIYHPRMRVGNVLGHVCLCLHLSVCLSACLSLCLCVCLYVFLSVQAITFEPLDIETSFFVCRYILTISSSSLSIKFIGWMSTSYKKNDHFTYFMLLILCMWLQIINKVKVTHQGESHIKVKGKYLTLSILCRPYCQQAGELHSTEMHSSYFQYL